MIGAIHNELNTRCNGAKFTDDELIANKREVIKHITLESLWPIGIIVIGIVTNDDVFR